MSALDIKNALSYYSDFCPEALEIMRALKVEGYSAYIVGGSVRDLILGRVSGDIDLTSNAPPNEIKRIFRSFKLDLKGERFGTVGVIINNKEYEITTFRSDGDYLDNRKPNSVDFCADIKSDALRRDFTCNSIYYNDSEGLIDLVGGINDVKLKILRAVGEPNARFSEDALRILRAVRFCSELGFSIEKNTQSALFSNAEGLKSLSAERVFSELKRTLLGDNAAYAIKNYFSLFAQAVEPLADYSATEVEKIANSIRFAEKNLIARLSLLFRFLPLCEVSSALDGLKSDCNLKNGVLATLKNAEFDFGSEKDIRLALNSAGENTCFNVLDFNAAICKDEQKRADILQKKAEIRRITEGGGAYSLKTLNINGNDLSVLKISGKRVGEVLNKLLEAAINGEVKNEKAELLNLAKKLAKTY